MSTSDQARIIIWSTPRSLSTAFTRSMSARGDTKVFWEPYLGCYNYGPDRKVHWADDIPGLLNDKYTFSYVKSLLEEPHSSNKVLFAKGMVEAIVDNFEVVASGYKHSFLIRHPLKVFRSYEKISKGALPIDFNSTFRNIFEEVEKFYHYVINELGQSAPPIIDSDDLLAHPEAVLTKYCDAVGIPFTRNMLRWESVENPTVLKWQCTDVGIITQDSYNNSVVLTKAFKSTGFGDGSKSKKSESDVQEYSAEVKECVELAMPPYERLYKLRLKPN